MRVKGGSARRTAGSAGGGSQESGAAPGRGSAASAPGSVFVSRPGGTLKLGFVVDTGNPGAVIGADLSSDEDFEREAKTIIRNLEAKGGFGGRKVQLVVKKVDRTNDDADSQRRQHEETCVSLTEDAKVFMAVGIADSFTDGFSCYAKHHTPVLGWEAANMDNKELAPLAAWVVPPISPVQDTILKFYPKALADQGFINKRMGIVSKDDPATRRTAATVLIPAIQRLGGKILDQRYFPATADGVASQAGGAVLDFKAKGIDRVIVWQVNGGWYGFTLFAERQDYHPRYGLTSFETPQQFIDSLPDGARIPPSQLRGAVGAGWSPDADVRETSYPPTTREKACWAVVNKGAATNYKTRADGLYASRMCQLFGSLRAALAPTVGRTLKASEVVAYFHRLGTSWVPMAVPKQRFAAGRLDSTAVYRRFAYDEPCDCFKYRSPFLDIP